MNSLNASSARSPSFVFPFSQFFFYLADGTGGTCRPNAVFSLPLLPHLLCRNLTAWAEAGVLMLNTCLTVRAHTAGSHQGKGWEQFTDRVIDVVDRYGGANLGEKSGFGRGVVFLAWGAWAAKRVAKLSKVSRSFSANLTEGSRPSWTPLLPPFLLRFQSPFFSFLVFLLDVDNIPFPPFPFRNSHVLMFTPTDQTPDSLECCKWGSLLSVPPRRRVLMIGARAPHFF